MRRAPGAFWALSVAAGLLAGAGWVARASPSPAVLPPAQEGPPVRVGLTAPGGPVSQVALKPVGWAGLGSGATCSSLELGPTTLALGPMDVDRAAEGSQTNPAIAAPSLVAWSAEGRWYVAPSSTPTGIQLGGTWWQWAPGPGKGTASLGAPVEMGPFSSWQQAWGVAQTLEGRGVVAAVRWEAPGRWWVWAWAPPPVTGAPSLDATAAVTKADPSLAAAYPPKLAFAGPLLAVWTGSSPLILAPALVAASGGCALKLAAPGVGPGPYAGALLLWPQRAPGDPSAGVGVANAVPLERYVADVLPCEMPASWPWAALQAQAIAIRTYALWAMNTRPPQSPWILSAGTEDQVYGGLGVETAVTNEAAWSTAGEVVTYQGSPIDALYEPDSGGHTASSAHVWGYALPYLVGVPEPPGYRPQRWVVHLTPAQVEARVRGATGTDVGQVLDLKVGSVGASGRVLALQVEGTLGTARLTLDQVRTALGLPSSHMRPSSNAQAWIRGASARIPVPFLAGRQAQGALSQRSIPTWGRVWVEGAQIATSLPTLPTLFTFAGAGLGPGLGMTQDGAFLLAQEGATPARILFYYYKGVTLSMWPGDVPPASRQGIP